MTDAGRSTGSGTSETSGGGEVAFDARVDSGADQQIGSGAMRVAALSDTISSNEYADREKDREALPELRALDREH